MSESKLIALIIISTESDFAGEPTFNQDVSEFVELEAIKCPL